MELRNATLADLELLVRHRRRMWEDMGTVREGQADPSEGPYRQWLAAGLGSGSVVGWVAQERIPVGSGLLWFQSWHPRPAIPDGAIPYLLSVYVEPSHRGHGVARAVTQAAIATAKARGHRRIGLHASEAGRPLYANLGFHAGAEMVLDLDPES